MRFSLEVRPKNSLNPKYGYNHPRKRRPKSNKKRNDLLIIGNKWNLLKNKTDKNTFLIDPILKSIFEFKSNKKHISLK